MWRAGRADGRWGNLAAIFVSVTIDYAKGSPHFGKGIRVSNDLKLTERIKRLVIIAMVSDDELLEKLVLKGGNLLDIAYGVSTRSSVDIDFSVDGDLESVRNLEDRLVNSLRTTFLPEGLTPFDFKFVPVPPKMSDDMKSFWGGYNIF